MTASVVSFDDLPSARELVAGLQFPESLRFADGEIYFSDISAVKAVDQLGNVRLVAEVPSPVTIGIAIGEDGTIHAAGAMDRKIYQVSGGEMHVVADLSAATEAPINEFVLLPNGGMIVGSMGWNPLIEGFGARRLARMLLVSPDGSIRETGPELMFANGMVLLDGGQSLWVAESLAGQIRRCRLGPDGDVIGDDTVKLHDSSLEPDGVCVSADGSLWFGEMTHGAAVRIGADGATEIYLEVPEPHAPSCLVYVEDGSEWLAVAVTVTGPGQGDPAARTGRIIAVPLDEIQRAAASTETS